MNKFLENFKLTRKVRGKQNKIFIIKNIESVVKCLPFLVPSQEGSNALPLISTKHSIHDFISVLHNYSKL